MQQNLRNSSQVGYSYGRTGGSIGKNLLGMQETQVHPGLGNLLERNITLSYSCMGNPGQRSLCHSP